MYMYVRKYASVYECMYVCMHMHVYTRLKAAPVANHMNNLNHIINNKTTTPSHSYFARSYPCTCYFPSLLCRIPVGLLPRSTGTPPATPAEETHN